MDKMTPNIDKLLPAVRDWVYATHEARNEWPCSEAIQWLLDEEIPDMATAWERCHRSDWMLWALETEAVDDAKMRLCACAFVRDVWHLLADERSRRAIEASEAYARGEASDGDLNAAWEAASKAAWAAASEAAWEAASEAASEAAWEAAWEAACARQADICRTFLGNPFYRDET